VTATAPVTIPYGFTPRDYQLPFLRAADAGIKRIVVVWHRRAGKDKTLFNLVVKRALERVGAYYYFFPTYRQGKKILWDGMDKGGSPFLAHIPASLIQSKNDTEMKIRLINGSVIQIIGTDNVDSIVGTNPIGCVFSEYALQDPLAWEYIRPILRENGGWAVFNFTPRGRNHGYALYQIALKNPDEWYCEVLTVDDTGALTRADIQAERDAGMAEGLIQQEFFCSFDAANDNQLIHFDHLIAASRADTAGDGSTPHTRVAVDVADGGVDATVITVARLYQTKIVGLRQVARRFPAAESPILAADAASALAREYGADDIVVDALGVGAGTAGALIRAGHTVIPYRGGGASDNPAKYRNRRTQSYLCVRDDLAAGRVAFATGWCDDQDEFLAQMCSVKSRPGAERVDDLETKEAMRQRGLKSPDRADSWAMMYATQAPHVASHGFAVTGIGDMMTSTEW